MGPELFVYGYGLVCISMLVFNLVYALHLRMGDRRMNAHMDRLRQQVNGELERLQSSPSLSGQQVSTRHLNWMNRHLSRISNLLAFDRLLDEMDPGQGTIMVRYVKQLQPVFLYLATVYLKREPTQAAYYCHFLSRHSLTRHLQADQTQHILLSYLRKDALYCKVNALKALCRIGSPDALVDALTELGRTSQMPLHEKVITEALLSYTGHAGQLIDQLLIQFDRFSLTIQRAILDYIRFQSGAYGQAMAQILRDPDRNKELRLSAIRYFGKYPDSGVRDLLLEWVDERDPLLWEYAAISATALASYPGQDVVDALLRALRSPNWYIRYNSSDSLEHHLSYEQLRQVLVEDDQFAREMLTYRLQSKQLEQPEGDDAGMSLEQREEAGVGV